MSPAPIDSVALSAVLLQTLQLFHSDGQSGMATDDIRIVFLLMGAMALTACIFYAQLDPNAGAEVSGHHNAGVEPVDAAAD